MAVTLDVRLKSRHVNCAAFLCTASIFGNVALDWVVPH